MNSIKILLSLFIIVTGIYPCISQNSLQEKKNKDATSKTLALPQGFEKRQQILSSIIEALHRKNYNLAIEQADKLVTDAITNQDTLHLRDAYRLLSKAYHKKGNIQQRDLCEQRIQELAISYGYHVDEG